MSNKPKKVSIGMYILKLRPKNPTPIQVKNKSPIVFVIKLIAEKPSE